MDVGISSFLTRLVFTIRTRARAAKPVQYPSLSLNSSGMSFALGDL